MTLDGDYLTTEEAALYCRVSRSKFYQVRDQLGLQPFPFAGKKLYRKRDLARLIENAAQQEYGNPIPAQR